MRRISNLLIIALSFFFMNGHTQDCVQFHRQHCLSYTSEGYKIASESRSFALKKGETARTDIEFYKGMDYHINFAVDDLFGSRLYVQIVDKQTQEIVYDNTEDQFNLDMEFSVIKNINVNIIIETPASVVEDSRYDFTGCIGMLIETRITPPMGFTE